MTDGPSVLSVDCESSLLHRLCLSPMGLHRGPFRPSVNDGKVCRAVVLGDPQTDTFEVLALRRCGEGYEMPHGRLVRQVGRTESVCSEVHALHFLHYHRFYIFFVYSDLDLITSRLLFASAS